MITKIYFYDPLPQAQGVSRKFAGKGLHAVDGFVIEELNVPGVYAVKVSHPEHGAWEVRDVRYEVFYDDRPKPLTSDQIVKLGLPPDLLHADASKIHESAAPTIKNFRSNMGSFLEKGYGLILCGGPGVGKSSAAAVLAKEAWYFTPCSSYFVTVFDLRELIKSKVNYDAQTTVIERCKDVKFLVLDFLREDDAKDPFFDAAALTSLVEHRSQNRKSTIITTRMTPQAMTDSFAYAMSILRAKSPLLRVEGDDRRKQQAEAAKSAIIKLPSK